MNGLAVSSGMALGRRRIPRGFVHITEDDYQEMVGMCSNATHRLLTKVLWTYGLRISEVLAIRVRDVDLKTARLRVFRLKKRNKDTKDVLPIPVDLMSEFRSLCKGKRTAEHVFQGDDRKTHNKRVRSGKAMSRQSAARAIKALGEKAQIEIKGELRGKRGTHVHPHAFRHGRVYDLVRKGHSPLIVARILGHSDLMTLMEYFHPQEADILQALDS